MVDERTVCAVCAWRKDCLKRFKYESSLHLRCPDYTRDLAFKEDEDNEEEKNS